MKKTIKSALLALLLFSMFFANAQSGAKRRNFFPIWTFQQSNVSIHGISVGILPMLTNASNVNTNGLRLELIGGGLFTFMIPGMNLKDNDSLYSKSDFTERVNGINLSGDGTVGDCRVNGLSAGFVGQIVSRVNGISASCINNLVEVNNGVQLAVFINISHRSNGLQVALFNNSNHSNGIQIGMVNKSRDLKGIQIGLWNKNNKRSLPFINWSFKKEKAY